ncbi:MAG: response regulator [Desulforhopalus sp.]
MSNPNYKILIADDNESIRELLKIMCSFYDLNTECVTNGQEAVKAFKQENFEIVLMDLDMPIMGGLEATRIIRQYEREKKRERTPIIAISGTTIRNPHCMCIEAGMDGFIPKPIELDEILDVIKTAIDLQGIED